MTKGFISFFLLFLFSVNLSAQNRDTTKLDNYFKVLADHNKFMGGVAVAQKGKIIYEYYAGFADVEKDLKINKDSKFRIGSISKTFTATLILKAVEQNKLTLSQTIEHYFPNINNADKITINQLLYHRSGLRNFTDDVTYLKWNTQPKSRQEMVELIAESGSEFEPGSTAKYSNSNYVLLTYILEDAFNQSYSDILQEIIVKPLNLKNTYFGNKIDIHHNESNSYTYLDNWNKETETDLSIPVGAGGIVSSPVDLTLFSEALFKQKIISGESVHTMESVKDGYAMGLFPVPFYEKTGIGHTGGIDGFSSVFGYFPEDEITFAITSNGMNYSINNIAIAVLSAVYNKDFEIPVFKTYELTSEQLDTYLGVYASKDIPLKITISKKDRTLIAQATGQPFFPLEPTDLHKFEFNQAGVIIEFDPSNHTFVLNQNGGTYTFNRE